MNTIEWFCGRVGGKTFSTLYQIFRNAALQEKLKAMVRTTNKKKLKRRSN